MSTEDLPNEINFLRLAQFYTAVLELKGDHSDRRSEACWNFIAAERVIKRGVDINYQRASRNANDKIFAGYTLLHFAVMERDLESVKILLSNGADFTIKSNDGQTPLHKAFQPEPGAIDSTVGGKSLVNAILSLQISTKNPTNSRDNNGISHFHIACIVNNTEAVEFFLNSGVSVNQAVYENSRIFPKFTALHFACKNLCLETVKMLLKYGADVDLKNSRGINPLHMTIETNRTIIDRNNIVFGWQNFEDELKINEAMINLMKEKRKCSPDDIGLSDLHILCASIHDDMTEAYLDKITDINASISIESPLWPGYTALHFAAHFNLKTVQSLVKRGANIAAKDHNGLSPLDFCRERYRPVVFDAIFDAKTIWSFVRNARNISSDYRDEMDMSPLELCLGRCTIPVIREISTSPEHLNFDVPSKQTLEGLMRIIRCYEEQMPEAFPIFHMNAVPLPIDSPIWPGYPILHLLICLIAASEREHVGPRMFFYEKLMRFFVENGSDISAKNQHGSTSIQLAFHVRDYFTVKLLFDALYQEIHRNPSYNLENVIDGKNDLSHFHIACATNHREMVKEYLKIGVDVNSLVKNSFLLSKHKYKDELITIKAGATPLHIAVVARNWMDHDIIEDLLDNGANPNIKDSDGLTPIHFALSLGFKWKVYEAVLCSGKVKNDVYRGISYLHVAGLNNREQLVGEFIEEGMDINMPLPPYKANWMEEFFKCPLSEGDTLLHIAVKSKNAPLIETLIKNRADVHLANSLGQSPLECYLNLPDFVIKNNLKLLSGSLVANMGFTELHSACVRLDLRLIEKLIGAGQADLNARVRAPGNVVMSGYTPLHMLFELAKYSSIFDDSESRSFQSIIQLLNDHGADASIKDAKNLTAIQVALKQTFHSQPVYVKSIKMAYTLLRRIESDRNLINDNGFSYLHLACCGYEDDTEIVGRYLKNPADVNLTVDEFSAGSNAWLFRGGFTPLHFAVSQGNNKVVDFLLKNGANVRAEDSDGNTPIHIAAKTCYLQEHILDRMLSYSMQQGAAGVNADNVWAERPMELLLKTDNPNCLNRRIGYIEIFLKYGCRVNIMNAVTSHKILALSIPSRRYSLENAMLPEFTAMLKSHDIKSIDTNGSNAIHNTVSKKNYSASYTMNRKNYYVDALEKLLELGCDIDHQDIKGRTPLHTAIEYRNLEAVKALLFLGADINIVDKAGFSPFSYGLEVRKCECSPNASCNILIEHIEKMIFINLYVSDQNKKDLHAVYYLKMENLIFDNTSSRYFSIEMKEVENCKINNRFDLRDFLYEKVLVKYLRSTQEDRASIDEFFQSSHEICEKFPQFGYFTLLNYRRACTRAFLLERATDAMISMDNRLPDLCLENIFQSLTNLDLRHFVEATEAMMGNA